MKKREIGAFEGMMDTAREWLAGRDPRKIAARAGVGFSGEGCFILHSLGREVRVSWPGYEIAPRLDPWHEMMLLHYLHLADGAPLCDRPMSFAELKDGMVRGGDFDRRCEADIRALGALEPEALRRRCEALGARFLEGNADLCAEFTFAPRFPLTLKLWFADEDFPASGRLLLDASADHYLTIEDAVTTGQLLMEALRRK